MLWYIPVITVTGVVHIFIGRWRSRGAKSYYPLYAIGLLVFAGTGLAMPYLLRIKTSLPSYLIPSGFVLLGCGLGFLFWSYKTLSFKTLAWLPELVRNEGLATPVQRGPYKFCRHPVYSAATIVMVAAFLITGVASLALPLVMLLGLTALEEMELRSRFGSAFENYSRQTPLFLRPKMPRRWGKRPSLKAAGEVASVAEQDT